MIALVTRVCRAQPSSMGAPNIFRYQFLGLLLRDGEGTILYLTLSRESPRIDPHQSISKQGDSTGWKTIDEGCIKYGIRRRLQPTSILTNRHPTHPLATFFRHERRYCAPLLPQSASFFDRFQQR